MRKDTARALTVPPCARPRRRRTDLPVFRSMAEPGRNQEAAAEWRRFICCTSLLGVVLWAALTVTQNAAAAIPEKDFGVLLLRIITG